MVIRGNFPELQGKSRAEKKSEVLIRNRMVKNGQSLVSEYFFVTIFVSTPQK